ncbi:hypothetical protein SE17_30220, partial [Kouleothrix aurantiaca]
GLEFARSVIEMKMLRNLNYVRARFARMERRVVPAHVFAALEPYAEAYAQAFGRPLEPQNRQTAEPASQVMETVNS